MKNLEMQKAESFDDWSPHSPTFSFGASNHMEFTLALPVKTNAGTYAVSGRTQILDNKSFRMDISPQSIMLFGFTLKIR
jgi:hypothetical protein